MAVQQGYSLVQMRAEMVRLNGIMMRKNEQYLKREEFLMRKYAADEEQIRNSKMNTDPLLRDYSAVAKTCATLIQGISAVIQAELAYVTYYRRYAGTSGGRERRVGGEV